MKCGSKLRPLYLLLAILIVFVSSTLISLSACTSTDTETSSIETCQQYLERRLSEGWKITDQDNFVVTLQSPEGIIKLLDLRNDVETLRPNAAGDVENLPVVVGDGVGTHYTTVDEAVADDNTSYVEQEQSGTNYDLYALPDSGVGAGTINSVKVYARGCSGTDGGETLTIMCKTEGTEYRDPAPDALPEAPYSNFDHTWTDNPNTSIAWTWTQIDALQVGIELYSNTDNDAVWARCTQVYVEVDYTPPGDWLGINSSHIDSLCGEQAPYTLAAALDGTNAWLHSDNEVHWFILDLGQTYTIKKVHGRSNNPDDPVDVDIYVSDDKGDWGAAVATGIATWQDTAEWAEVDTTDKDGRYIKVVINDTEDVSRVLAWGKSAAPFITIFDAYGEIAVATPTVTTQAVTDIAATTATGNGNITDTGGEDASAWGVCYNTTGNPTTADDTAAGTGAGGVGAFTASMVGLTPGEHYYVKAYATNSEGTGYGSQVEFTTKGPPSVTTSAATLVEETTATLNGNITSVNDGSCSARGFQWDIDSGAPYANDWSESDSYGTGAFSHGITSLAKGELYYFRAYATNTYGTGYGDEVTFLTKPDAPYSLLATATADGVITLTWSKGDGAQNTYIRGEQGSYPTDRADGYLVYNDTGTTDTDTGLTGGLLYYYRAWSYATEGGKEQYSDAYDEDYSIAIEAPSITTNTPTDVETTTATLQANMTDTGGSLADYRGFVWDTTTRGDPGDTAPADSDYTDYNTTSGSYDTGAFTHNVTTLTEGTPYYVRGCAHNTMGWSYGSEISFSTRDEVLYFQPNAIITGTALPDRAGSNDGTITWGSNPSGVSVEVGGLEATGVTAEITTEEPTPPDYVDDTPATDMFTETTGENIPVFYPIFKMTSDITGWPIQIFWMTGALVIAIVVGALAMMFLHSILIAGFASGAVVVAACSMEVISWWVLYVYIIMAACFWIYQRVVSV